MPDSNFAQLADWDMSKAETLSINHPAVKYLCEKDKRLAKVVKMVGPIQIHLALVELGLKQAE